MISVSNSREETLTFETILIRVAQYEGQTPYPIKDPQLTGPKKKKNAKRKMVLKLKYRYLANLVTDGHYFKAFGRTLWRSLDSTTRRDIKRILVRNESIDRKSEWVNSIKQNEMLKYYFPKRP